MLLLIMKGFTIPKHSRSTAVRYFSEIVDEISKLFPAMIKTLRAEQAKLLGVDIDHLGYNANTNPPYNQNNFVDCEIFIADDYLLTLSLESDVANNTPSTLPTLVGICYIGPSLEYEAVLAPISAIVQSKFKTPVGPLHYTDRHFDSIRSKATMGHLKIDGIDQASIEVLSRRSYRTLATAIAMKSSAGGLLLADAGKKRQREDPREDPNEISAIKDQLIDVGLASPGFVIICSVSNSRVIRVDSTESLIEFANKGLKCACGRPISAETPQEVLTITTNGRLLLDKSLWMTILLKQRLEALGVQSYNILLECQIGGNEIDCIASIGGEIVMFELKDKEFSLGNAYALWAKISLVEPQHTVIITTDRVGNDVKEYFRSLGMGRRRTSSPPGVTSQITYIEGMEDFQAGLDNVVFEIYQRKAREIIVSALSFVSAGPSALIKRIE
jgi:hypothetical protein